MEIGKTPSIRNLNRLGLTCLCLFGRRDQARMEYMVGIRVHFNGEAFVPDEPLDASPDTPVVMLFESAHGESNRNLEKAIRENYEARDSQADEDDSWGRPIAQDSKNAWEQD